MAIIMIISVIVVVLVLVLSVLAINKGYQFKHTVDSLEDNPHIPPNDQQEKSDQQ